MILYFTELNEETACTKAAIIAGMKDAGLESMVVSKAVRSIHEGFFYCSLYQLPTITDDDVCGKQCEGYQPRNGKSGICRHWRHCYEPGDEYTLNVNGKLERKANERHNH